MTLRTRLTEKLGIRHPVLLAPMGGIAGGRLAGAVSEAGGLALIGDAWSDNGVRLRRNITERTDVRKQTALAAVHS